MAERNVKSVISLSREILGIFSGHYQSQVFNPDADVFYVGGMIEKLREIIAEATEELENRKPKAAFRYADKCAEVNIEDVDIASIINNS